MKIFPITTIHDLLNFLNTLAEEQASSFRGSLEEYLRSLWALIQEHQNSLVTPTLGGYLFSAALTKEPAPFEESWLHYQSPPLHNEQIDDYEYLQQMILYQIADLYRMGQAGLLQLDALTLYGGIDSPTGHRWYNFHPADYLESGSRGFYAHCQSFTRKPQLAISNNLRDLLNQFPTLGRPLASEECSWFDLAEILYLGQIYE